MLYIFSIFGEVSNFNFDEFEILKFFQQSASYSKCLINEICMSHFCPSFVESWHSMYAPNLRALHVKIISLFIQ